MIPDVSRPSPHSKPLESSNYSPIVDLIVELYRYTGKPAPVTVLVRGNYTLKERRYACIY